MVPYADWLYWMSFAQDCHAIVWWHLWEDGSFQPLLMPVNDETWEELLQ